MSNLRFIKKNLTAPLTPLSPKLAEGKAIPPEIDGVAQEDNSYMIQNNYNNARSWQIKVYGETN